MTAETAETGRGTGSISWMSDQQSHGVRERVFHIYRGERLIPGALWTPAGASGPRPLVLLGHGASGNKDQDYIVSMARRLVKHRGLAAAAIDGPVHGDRRPIVRPNGPHGSNQVFIDFAQAWSSDDTLTAEMGADYGVTLDELQALEDVGRGPAGWWGVSMGTILGLPYVAGDERISAAVLGLMGLTGPTQIQIAAAAANIRCPILFLVQWDDELFAREAAFELFGALASQDKHMHVNPGTHGAVPVEEMDHSEAFLAAKLGG